MKQDDIAEQLAPTAPPCFPDRKTWIEFVRSAATAHHAGDAPGPLRFHRPPASGAPLVLRDVRIVVFDRSRAVTFNPAFSFCADCAKSYSDRMKAAGRCQPEHVKRALVGEREAEPA